MLSDVEEGNNLMPTRLTPVATLFDTKQQSAVVCLGEASEALASGPPSGVTRINFSYFW